MNTKNHKIIGVFLIITMLCIVGYYYYHYNKISEIDNKSLSSHKKINNQSRSEYVYIRPNVQFNEERQKSVDICESLNFVVEIIFFLSLTNLIIMKFNKKKVIKSKPQ